MPAADQAVLDLERVELMSTNTANGWGKRSGGMSHPPSPRKSAVFRGSPPITALRAAAGKCANSPFIAISVLRDT
jgi:hypothetical protein